MTLYTVYSHDSDDDHATLTVTCCKLKGRTSGMISFLPSRAEYRLETTSILPRNTSKCTYTSLRVRSCMRVRGAGFSPRYILSSYQMSRSRKRESVQRMCKAARTMTVSPFCTPRPNPVSRS